MQILGKSYQVLSDPLQRDAYDRNEKKKKIIKNLHILLLLYACACYENIVSCLTKLFSYYY